MNFEKERQKADVNKVDIVCLFVLAVYPCKQVLLMMPCNFQLCCCRLAPFSTQWHQHSGHECQRRPMFNQQQSQIQHHQEKSNTRQNVPKVQNVFLLLLSLFMQVLGNSGGSCVMQWSLYSSLIWLWLGGGVCPVSTCLSRPENTGELRFWNKGAYCCEIFKFYYL